MYDKKIFKNYNDLFRIKINSKSCRTKLLLKSEFSNYYSTLINFSIYSVFNSKIKASPFISIRFKFCHHDSK